MKIFNRLCSVQRTAITGVALWMLILIYLSISLFTVQNREVEKESNDDEIVEQYGNAIKKIDILLKENLNLKNRLREMDTKITDCKRQTSISFNEKRRPTRPPSIILDTLNITHQNQQNIDLFSMDHEIKRRELDNSIRELYYYLLDQFSRHSNITFEEHATNQMLSLLGQSAAFSDVDGASVWRKNALANISSNMQSHIDRLQNPDDCKSARKLVCNLNKGCGFGCQLHHVTYCFVVAFGTNRTLILSDDGSQWSYSPSGWNTAFLPISKCTYNQISTDGDRIVSWKSIKDSEPDKVVSLPIVDTLSGRPPWLPLAFPEFLSSSLLTFHSYPPVFFISQLMRYLMRPSTEMADRILQAESKIPFNEGPIVGLQIRRTDKVGSEAAFHGLEEYMKWTEHWFRIQEYRTGKTIKRRIFIATDDPSVFAEARKSFSNYEVYGDEQIAETAQLKSRYTTSSLFGVVIDIEILAKCSYLVCTFSSQVCRMGYELMQIRVGDAGDRFQSLDDIYYYGGQQAHEQVVVEPYHLELNGEINLEIGDVIGIAGNHWNGFSKGTNRRTGAVGLYPSYKVREKWIIQPFP